MSRIISPPTIREAGYTIYHITNFQYQNSELVLGGSHYYGDFGAYECVCTESTLGKYLPLPYCDMSPESMSKVIFRATVVTPTPLRCAISLWLSSTEESEYSLRTARYIHLAVGASPFHRDDCMNVSVSTILFISVSFHGMIGETYQSSELALGESHYYDIIILWRSQGR